MASTRKILRTPFSRLFLIEDGAGPGNAPIYQTLGRALGLSEEAGTITRIEAPDPANYGEFITVDKSRGQRGLPQISIEARMTRELSTLRRAFEKGCAIDLHVHAGLCQDPQDFDLGWETGWILENADVQSYSTGELGALDSSADAPVNETLPLVGDRWYQFVPVAVGEIGEGPIVQEIVAVAIIDRKTCGVCGIASNGCDKLFAVTKSHGASPGLPAELIFSEDGGGTVQDTPITTLAANQDPTDLFGSGQFVVVLSAESLSHHYALIADTLEGTEAWGEVDGGYVATHGPRAGFSLGRTFNWIVGNLGYIYFTEDPTSAVQVQDAGNVTAEHYRDVHGVDELNLIAVAENNSGAVTQDGENWAAFVGPSPGDDLLTCWMRSEQEWLVGTDAGELWYTRNAGRTWTQKRFAGDADGSVKKISFGSRNIGYMIHQPSVGAARIFRTLNGGFSWYVIPEGTGSIPDNDTLNDIAACVDNVNFGITGGLAGDAVDGIFLRISGA